MTDFQKKPRRTGDKVPNPPQQAPGAADLTAINGTGRNARGQFTTGNSGRPVGARNRLSEQFLSALAADWEVHGVSVLKEVREQRPAEYLRVIASVLPKEMHVETPGEFEHLSDEELDRQVKQMAREVLGL